MPAPLANRFSHYEFDVHLDDWMAWAGHHQIDERIIAFLRFRPELIFDFDPAHNPVAFPSPRSWEFAHRALQKFCGSENLLAGTLQSCVGPAAGIELKAFIDNLDNLPDIDAILAGEDIAVPEEIDLQYAVASSLVGCAIRVKDEDNTDEIFGNILNYGGSISDDEMNGFFSEINAIKGQMRARVTLHACDEQMADNGPWVYEAWEEITIPENIKGGGGTDFRPAIKWVNQCDCRPDLLVYFTDAQGRFPEMEPLYPVIWLIKGKSPVPWGKRIQLN